MKTFIWTVLLAGVLCPEVVADPINERMERLHNACVQAVDSRIAGQDPSTSMPLFSNLTPKWTLTTFVPNSHFWLKDIRAQITGIHMGADDWTQSYGLMPITKRHCLSCGHNGPPPGKVVKYVNTNGEVFEARILKWINDHPGLGQDRVSDQKQAGPHPDLSVYLLDKELPDWVRIAPIFPKLKSDELSYLSLHNTPAICISQGNVDDTTLPAAQRTPNNRMAYITRFPGLGPGDTALRNPFYHSVYTGDSGTPMYLLVGDTLYLYSLVSGAVVADQLPYINSMIVRANVTAGLPAAGFTVTEAAWPFN